MNDAIDRPGRELVWDYPRPQRVEPCSKRLRLELNGETLADTRSAFRVLETSHRRAYCIPQVDRMELVRQNASRNFCEFKGNARYWEVRAGARTSSYPSSSQPCAVLRDHLSFYAQRVDGCFVDEERVQPQKSDFLGGWIPSNIQRPFKGGPGTRGW
jgi:uncharacterized protein (DUF427 family)